MSTTPRLAPAVEDLLGDLLDAAYDKRLPTATLESLLASLLAQADVAAFWNAGPHPDKLAALRAELHAIQQQEAALHAAQRASLRSRLNRMRKSLSRIGLPRTATVLAQMRDDSPAFGKDVEHVLLRALLREPPPRSVGAIDLLLSILENSAGRASELLRRHGVSRYEPVCHLTRLAHPLPVAPQAWPPDATALRLFLRNDDFTPMDFVVDVLQAVFSLSPAAADAMMHEVHDKGHACCGTFPLPLAQEKLRQVADLAAAQQHPLRAFLQAASQDAEALMA
ncbi:ATP-dependent Clp protease adaptor ClpS [Pseudoduganella sp.]|uniref:ATP-dependent Clp protease adaptor ClpS n=1 Tax=Pseudoduganella sp. TaxID=1880898 RepID=UPI0035B121A6